MSRGASGLSAVADRFTDALWRRRRPLATLAVAGAVLLAPRADFRALDNDISAWFRHDDPVYADYERLKAEFPGSRTLIIALESPDAFSRESLESLRTITRELEQVEAVRRVQSLATANRVTLQRSPPVDDSNAQGAGAAAGEAEDELRVEPVLDPTGDFDPELVRRHALSDRLVAGDLVSASGRVSAIIVSFDESRIDAIRADVLADVRRRVDANLPRGVTAHYNGSLEISETYNRVTLRNQVVFTPPILLLTITALWVMFRSWRITVLTVAAVLVSLVWTLGLYVSAGFTFNVLTSMLGPLVIVLAIADDVHIIQHYTQRRRAGADHEQAWRHTVRHLVTPLLAASGTTALGLLSLATSQVDAVRSFGIGAAVGVMVDFVISLVLMPTLLGWVRVSDQAPPQARWLLGPLRAVSRISTTHPARVIACAALVVAVAVVGLFRLRVDTNHVSFFRPGHPIHDSASVIDRELAGIYSFQVLLEGEPESLRSPEVLARIDRLGQRLEQLGHVRKVVSLSDYVARVHEQLAPDAVARGERLPADADLIAQELFVFGLSEEGRRELETVVSSDYSRTQVMVKLTSMSSDEAFHEVEQADRIARDLMAGTGITPTVTGAGRLFATLDHYIVTSQVSSFATAFLSVFGVIFLVFRSFRFGALAIVPNVVPVIVVLGVMGWLDITMNVATVMVASIALGVVDDDTIHFISRYRRETSAGRTSEQAIATATEEEGRASLTTAIINTLAFSVLAVSEYRPSGWFGGMLALTMAVAFLAEVFLLPAIIRLAPRWFGAPGLSNPLLVLLTLLALPSVVDAQPTVTSRGSVSAMFDTLPGVDAAELRVRTDGAADVELSPAWTFRIASWVDGLVGRRRGEGVADATWQPGEIHARYRHERFDVTAGFQRVVWGTLDEIQPTDVVNPLDVSRFLIEGRSDARLPVLALRGRVFLPGDTTVDAVYVPLFRRGRYDLLDEPSSPFNLLADTCAGEVCRATVDTPAGPAAVRVPLVSRAPAWTWGNGSVGVRATRTLGGVDVGASVYRGWQAFPLVALEPTGRDPASGGPVEPVAVLTESWSRLTMIGGDAEAARGAITWRAEGAWLVDTGVQDVPGGPIVDGRTLQVGGGLDWTAGPWRSFGTVIVRRSWAVGPQASLVPSAGGLQLVGGTERTFARETWRMRGFLVVDPTEGTAFVRGLAAWNLRDNLWLEGAVAAFAGDGTDFLGRYTDRDFASVRMKYYF